MTKPSGQTVFLICVVAMSVTLIGYLLLGDSSDGLARDGAAAPSRLTLQDIPFNGAQAYEYLKALCALGPRYSGSPGMTQQQQMLEEHFRKQGATVRRQTFAVRHPRDGSRVEMANLIIQWRPERMERVLLAAHYDTRPFPDRDPVNPRGVFVGANDGASGVAVLMELGAQMATLPGKLGVDFVLFDGEELVYDDDDNYFIGSEFFSRDYAAERPAYKYRWAVLLDMVGDSNLQILQEQNSLRWPDSRPLVKSIWETAGRLKVREFIPRLGHEIRDDHLKLHNTAGIPACDLIDFDYPYWHTAADTPDKCSALSLAKVGWVVDEWLKQAVQKP